MTQTKPVESLYKSDFALWLDETITQLKSGNLHDVDITSLVEELESLAGSDRRELKNRLKVLLTHILKRQYVNLPDNYRGWVDTIDEQQSQLSDLLEQSPSLRRYFSEVFDEAWQYALRKVKKDYPKTNFPDAWEFSRDIDTILAQVWRIS